MFRRAGLSRTASAGAARQQRAAGLVVAGSGGRGPAPGSGGGGGGEQPLRLSPDDQRRAISVLNGALDLKKWRSQLGGTLIVDDASHKAEVQQVCVSCSTAAIDVHCRS